MSISFRLLPILAFVATFAFAQDDFGSSFDNNTSYSSEEYSDSQENSFSGTEFGDSEESEAQRQNALLPQAPRHCHRP